VDFLLGNTYLGSAPNPAPDPRTLHSHSIALFCPTCGELWGRVIVNPREHFVLTRTCPSCPPKWGMEFGGYFLSPPDAAWWKVPQLVMTATSPIDVLKHDFLQLLKQEQQHGT
jgi:hypothetical protein